MMGGWEFNNFGIYIESNNRKNETKTIEKKYIIIMFYH